MQMDQLEKKKNRVNILFLSKVTLDKGKTIWQNWPFAKSRPP